ncbi:MAG: hypothetical protein HFACDABA_00834 [Anaerolineales bacterium]|nr:hypothetical protein [Anaerolineales bacterium]
MQNQPFIRDLGNGLILRHASKRDARALADFNARMHGDDKADGLRVAAWTRDLIAKPHPTVTANDFMIVEETASRRIVSSLGLIPQTWTYDGIPFNMGRPELIATLPEFRGRGLIRIQFDEVHKWCEQRGLIVQGITGIPYFYRQFGYEMALEFVGRRFGFEPNVPRLKKGKRETYRIRPALKRDLAFIARTYAETQNRYMLSCLRGPDVFEYELQTQSKSNAQFFELRIIEDARGKRIGYFQHPNHLGLTGLTAVGYELQPGASWLGVTPAVVRYLWATGEKYARRDKQTRVSFGFMLGTEHPAYEALADSLPVVRDPYAWYLRVADLPGFLRHIAPVLEKRLAESIACGYSGSLKISFYTSGLRMLFRNGKLKKVETWKPVNNDDEGDAAFPGRTFLQALFGYRSFDELRYAFKDCHYENINARVLLNILFPKRLSDVFPVF